LLGWHPEGEREIFSLDELVAAFNLSRIQKGAGVFDETKLRWFNHEHLKRLDPEVYAARLRDFAKRDVDLRLVPLLKERAATLKEAAEVIDAEFSFLRGADADPALLLNGGKIEPAAASTHLRAAAGILESLSDERFTPEDIKGALWPYASEQGRGAVLWSLRVALSGKEQSPDPFIIASLL